MTWEQASARRRLDPDALLAFVTEATSIPCDLEVLFAYLSLRGQLEEHLEERFWRPSEDGATL